MKISTLCMWIGIATCLATSTYSQETFFNMDLRNEQVKTVFDEIEKNSEFVIFYLDNSVNLKRKVNVQVENEPVEEILEQVFNGTPTAFNVEGRQITIFKKETAPATIPQQVVRKEIKGRVLEFGDEPVIGANIIEKGTTNGTITDFDGNFILSVPVNSTIVISFLGYTSQEIQITETTPDFLQIELKEDNVMLGEVVAIGYAVGSRQTISGAVQKISKDDMNAGVVNNPLDAIQGKVAGVNIQSTSGDPTVTPNIRIRGTTSLSGGNDPLVVIDGVMGNLAMLNSLSPNDIESFTILKDASETAQYGSRGASGVIVVTTSKGKFGSSSLSYDGNFGVQTIAKRIHMLSADQYRTASQNLGLSFEDRGFDTDFMDEVLRTGYTQNHRVSFGKGDENSNYNVSLGVIDQKGLVETNNSQRFTLKLDASQTFFENRLKLESGIFASKTASRNLNESRRMFYGAATMNPTYPNLPNEDGTWPFDPVTSSEIYNPLDILSVTDRSKVYNATAHGRLTWTILEGLKLSAFGSYTLSDKEGSIYMPTTSKIGIDKNGGRGVRSDDKNENYLGNISLSYIKTIDKHHINVLGLIEGQEYKNRGFSAASSNYSSDYSGADNLKGGAIINYGDVQSWKYDYRLISWLTRFNYVYNNKYIATINMRQDGSSKLGSNNKWGFFPSFSLAWNMANEDFMKELGLFDELKVRASYGVTGNQDAISPYNSLQLLEPVLVSVDGNSKVAYQYTRNANPDLKWETKKTFDIGLDAAVWNKRIHFTFDYYNSNTDDMLYSYSVPQPPFIFNELLANIGSMNNQGLEFSVDVAAIQTKDIGLDISANFSYQKNKVTSLTGTYQGQELTPSAYTTLSRVRGAGVQGNVGPVYMFEGHPLGVFYLPKADGLKNVDGKNEYNIVDLDNSGDIDVSEGNDRYITGQVIPKYYLGTNIRFRYKLFDIQTQLNGAFGHKIYNGTAATLNNMNNFPNYNVLEGAPEKNIYDNRITDYWLENGNYLNIAYITLGYNIDTSKFKNWVKSIRITASVNNVHTFTSYTGLTPMINSSTRTNNDTFGLDDKTFYPVARTYSLGVSVNF